MNYNDLSISDFCFCLIGKYQNNTIKERPSEFEMYDFISKKTENFEQIKFVYFMRELRGFVYKLPIYIHERNKEFESNLIKTELEDNLSGYNIKETNLNDYLFLNCCNFETHYSLRERIQQIPNFVKEEKIVFDYLIYLYEFSDLAEIEFKKIKPNLPFWDNDYFNELKFTNDIDDKEYTYVFDFVSDTFNQANQRAENEIKYELNQGDFLKKDVNDILSSLHTRYSDLIEQPNKLLYISLIKNFKFDKFNRGYDNKSINDLLMQISYTLWKYFELGFALSQSNEKENIKVELIKSFTPFLIIEKISTLLSTNTKIKIPLSKQSLNFAELFIPEFQKKISVMFERLQLNGFIDKNNDWIINTNINEPAKLYYYLKDNKLLKQNKFAPAIKCFYKEFGCEVVEKANGNSRACTRTNLLIQCDNETEKTFNSFLLTLINQK